jgi:hypothetical protein
LPDWRWRWRCRSIREIDDVRRRARWGRKGRSAGGGLRTLGPPRWVARRPRRGWGRRLEWHVGDNDAWREQVARAPSLQRVVVAIGSTFLRRPAVVQQVACPPRRGGLDQGRLSGRWHRQHPDQNMRFPANIILVAKSRLLPAQTFTCFSVHVPFRKEPTLSIKLGAAEF